MEPINKRIANIIHSLKSSLPNRVLQKHFEIDPQLKQSYNQQQIDHYLQDTSYHLSYIAEAVSANEPVLFCEYMKWLKTFFTGLGIADKGIIANLLLIKDAINENLTPEEKELLELYFNGGMNCYNSQPGQIDSFIREDNPLKNIAAPYLDYLINGRRNDALDLIMKEVKNGTPLKDIYLHVFAASQKEIGRLWQLNKINVAQEHYITAATQLIMSQLYPYLFTPQKHDKKIIVTCINGELHELAPRMVADIFELEGWDSYYLGANTPQSGIIKTTEEVKPHIVAISVTMTFNLGSAAELIEKIRNNRGTGHVKIMVGGYPFTVAPNLWNGMGADGFGADAVSAVNTANELYNMMEIK